MNPFDNGSPRGGRHGHREHGRHHEHHHHLHFGRHGGRGMGPGEGHGGPGRHGHGLGGFERGRKFGASDLQLLILALLEDKASHGYELIKALEQRSHGYYVPSPGMIYPSLSYLEEIGHASVEADGAKKRYTISAEGRAHLDAHRTAVDALWAQLAWFGERMTRLREVVGEEQSGEAPRGGGRGRRVDWPSPLREAIDALKTALSGRQGAGEAELQRVATILRQAAADIREA